MDRRRFPPDEEVAPRAWAGLAVVAAALFVATLDAMMLYVAFGTIRRDFPDSHQRLMSLSADQEAAAQSAEATVKTPIPARKTRRRPRRSAHRPAPIIPAARTIV